MSDLISIIVPCYNSGETLNETIYSLLNQSYKNIEIVCINDGSNDNTLDLLKFWKNKDTRFRVISQENSGVSVARNNGLSVALGKYIMFCDSDDMYHPKMVELLYNTICNTSTDVAYCKLSHDKTIITNMINDCHGIIQTMDEAMDNLLYRMGEIGFYCYLYKKEILEKNNILFDVHTRFFEDREFNWKYLANCKSSTLINECLYFYRINQGSVTQQKSVKWRTDSLDAVLRVSDYMKYKGLPYHKKISEVLLSRVMWGMAKNYSASGNMENFRRLLNTYDVEKCMKVTSLDHNFAVRLSSQLFLFKPIMFYYFIKYTYRIKVLIFKGLYK